MPGNPCRVIGRYALYDEVASGGMATVYFGRLLGPVGFSRTVAIKCLHPQYAKDPQFVSMFLDEARLAARIQHPNVVSTLDVVAMEGELFLVMDYVQGESLSRLMRKLQERGERVPARIAVTIIIGVLYGLQAAHEARSERGEPLGIVHRDISPQNVLVGVDGVARVLDFGVAKATGRIQTTHEGQLKGKVAYMAPEQIMGKTVDRRTDVYAAGVVLWEALTGKRLFEGDNPAVIMNQVLGGRIDPPSRLVAGLSNAVDAVVLRALAPEASARYATARDMAAGLERVLALTSPREVGDWVVRTAGPLLGKRAEKLAEIESASSSQYVQPGLAPAAPVIHVSPGQDPSSVPSRTSVPGIQDTGLSLTTSGLITGRNSKALGMAIVGGALAAGMAIAALLVATRPPASMLPAVPARPGAALSGLGVASAEPLPTIASAQLDTGSQTPPPKPKTVKNPLRPPSPPPAATKPPPAARCNPPYWVDSNGIRHPKPECL